MVAGFLFAFAVIVMPGIGTLSDRDFLQSFKMMDRIIQKNHPIFLIVWIGSILTLILTLILGIGQLETFELLLLIIATCVYLLGVQLPTMIFNIPLNNKLQNLEVDNIDEKAVILARENFEPRWNRWNLIRTVLAIIASALLIILLIRV